MGLEVGPEVGVEAARRTGEIVVDFCHIFLVAAIMSLFCVQIYEQIRSFESFCVKGCMFLPP